jgi:hypothetical protein
MAPSSASGGAFVMAPSSASGAPDHPPMTHWPKGGGAFDMAPSSVSGAPNHPPRTHWSKGGVRYGPFLGFGRQHLVTIW